MNAPHPQQNGLMQRLKPLTAPFIAIVYSESFGGVLLALGTFLALFFANTSLADSYQQLQNFAVQVRLGELLNIDMPLTHWVNDLLMAVFFFLVGLEIKLELMEGQLRDKKAALVPFLAAVGGLLVPALIYAFFNRHDAFLLRGWAIPSATDIAFALGILILLGKRVPAGLKVILTAIAIIDDLGAIVIIALFYTADLQLHMLQWAAYCVLAMVLLNRLHIDRLGLYLLLGLFLWVFLFQSGIHATLAGVLTALCVPLYSKKRAAEGWTDTDVRQGDAPQYHSPLKSTIRSLHPWVAYVVLPVFAFLNAGLALDGLSRETLMHSLPLGIVLGLLLGKPIGIFTTLFFSMKWLRQPLPKGCGWSHMLGLSMLCGVGFTMCLFVGGLAFGGQADYEAELKAGVLLGSLLSALAGSALLLLIQPKIPALRVVK